jgi:ABC-2 type transport system ATP-binding protein
MRAASARSTGCPVEIEDLTKRYGDVRALDGVSLQTAPGEIFGLLGHNGAGKSTMIRILTGRAKPTSGRVRVLGHDVPRHSTRAEA